MQVSVTGKQVDVGDALRRHVEAGLGALLDKYFGSAIEAHAVFAKEAHRIRADLSIHIGRGIVINGGGVDDDFYAAFDGAAERVGKQLRRYKRRLRDHNARPRPPAEIEVEAPMQARSYILAPVDDEAPAPAADPAAGDPGAPAVIAEMSTDLPSLTVGEAAMRMDLADMPVLLFRSRSHGALNLVYRRRDGHIGWIDPGLDQGPARPPPRR